MHALDIVCSQVLSQVVCRPAAPTRVQKFKLGQDLQSGHLSNLETYGAVILCV